MFKAEIIADSKNEFGNRITTFIVTFPRIILAEFNTHRMLSRNSASSRAIPFEKMVKTVKENPFIPIKWMKDHKGMQGSEYFETMYAKRVLEQDWLKARDEAVVQAEALNKAGVTKQFCNRLLEPFMWHTVIVTATEWENFFALRAHEAAEIHMQKIAYMMLEEYNKSEPKLLKPGEWHIPFGDKIGMSVKVSTAMCARVSYTAFGEDGKLYTSDECVRLHDKLLAMGHMSPFEHCAKAMNQFERIGYLNYCGNFQGFIQYRKQIENENKTDGRVIKK